MLTLLVDAELNAHVCSQLFGRLEDAGFDVATWVPGRPVLILGVDALVVSENGVADAFSVLPSIGHPRLIVVAEDPTADCTRHLLKAGADAVLGTAQMDHAAIAWVVAAAALGFGVTPPDHVNDLAVRLQTPPARLAAVDADLLAALSTNTIEEAGQRLGYSRRHTQRRFTAICERFGFSNRLEAVVAAVQWGLTEAPTREADGT